MLRIETFKRLGLLYIIALSCIALSIIGSQVYIQKFISKQTYDSRVINLAGRQRMLSQKISKIALEIQSDKLNASRTKALSEALDLWTSSHEGLLNGNDSLGLDGSNSNEILKLFVVIEPHYQAMVESARSILEQVSSNPEDSLVINSYIQSILEHEKSFLLGMDDIVFQYDKEAKTKVEDLKRIEIILFGVAIAVIILEFFFFFLPTSKKVASTFESMTQSEENAKKMTKEINKLYIELGKSYQDLESVNLVPDEPGILMKMDIAGNISFIADKFQKLLEFEENDIPKNFIQWLGQEGYGKDFIQDVFTDISKGKNWNGEIKLNSGAGDILWYDIYMVPVIGEKDSNKEILVLGIDLTDIKEAKMRSREINREQVEKKVKEQQYRSVLILEGQEEERKRISQEIHDGIGQMLTALKLNLEGLTTSSSPHMKKRLEDTKSLMKGVIKEVRRVSFNLTPSSLGDFGLVAAMKKLSTEISALTSTNVTFENRTNFINRLDNNVETNLFRVVQEAVNNAIKYAKAEKIVISFEHNANDLMVCIEDDGLGFDFEKLSSAGHFDSSGHGIFNMKERTAFIDGKLDVKTAPGEGTKIIITLPLN